MSTFSSTPVYRPLPQRVRNVKTTTTKPITNKKPKNIPKEKPPYQFYNNPKLGKMYVGAEPDSSRHMAWRSVRTDSSGKLIGSFVEFRFATPFAQRLDHCMFLNHIRDPSTGAHHTYALSCNLQGTSLPRDIFSAKYTIQERREAANHIKGFIRQALSAYEQRLDLLASEPESYTTNPKAAGRVITI